MLYTNLVLISAQIRTPWFVGQVGQTQTVIQIAPFYAIVIAIAILMTGILVGIWAGWFLTGQDLKRAKLDNVRLRESWETGKATQTQLTRDRDHALQELKDVRDQIDMTDAQLKLRQRLLDQTNDYLQNNEQQLNLAHANLKQQRQIVEELRTHLIVAEQLASERQADIADLQKELKTLRRGLVDAVRVGVVER